MFTGLVEEVGAVGRVEDLGGKRRISFLAPGIGGALSIGDSVAVDGACLTVVEADAGGFAVEAIATTLGRTTLGGWREGTRVNLERALRLGDRLGGHLVQGHVDGLGRLLGVVPGGEYHLMDFQVPPAVDESTVLHGSITINGVSLTVNALPDPGRCQVAIIPHTWEHTNLSLLRPGDAVNLEADLIGKYVGRILAARGPEHALGRPLRLGDLRAPDEE